jgi:hypothetical protein
LSISEELLFLWDTYKYLFDLCYLANLNQVVLVNLSPSQVQISRKNMAADMLMQNLLNEQHATSSLPLGTELQRSVDSLRDLLVKSGDTMRFETIFSGPSRVPLVLEYDDYHMQLVYKKNTMPKSFKFASASRRMNTVEKSAVAILYTMWAQIEALVCDVGGLRGRQLEGMSLLRSVPGGSDQSVHVDFIEKGEERILIAFLPLVGPCAIGVNRTAQKWYKDTGTHCFFHVPKEQCVHNKLEFEKNFMHFLWSDLPHYGLAYQETSYRLQVVFAQPPPNQGPPPDVTYPMACPTEWDTFHSNLLTEEDAAKYGIQLTQKQQDIMEKARKLI